MKTKFLITLILYFLISSYSLSSSENELCEKEKLNSPIAFSIIPSLSTNDNSKAELNNLHLSFLYGESAYLNGFSFSTIAQYTNCETNGVQLSLFNFTGNYLRGAQVGLSNVVYGNASGVQAGIFNLSGSNSSKIKNRKSGSQIGIANFGENTLGAQVGILNIGADVIGSQIGLINIAQSITGTQFGLVNYTETSKNGASISLLSIVKDGTYRLFISGSSDYYFSTGIYFGDKYIYNIAQYMIENSNNISNKNRFGYGVGLRYPYGDYFASLETIFDITEIFSNKYVTQNIQLITGYNLFLDIDII